MHFFLTVDLRGFDLLRMDWQLIPVLVAGCSAVVLACTAAAAVVLKLRARQDSVEAVLDFQPPTARDPPKPTRKDADAAAVLWNVWRMLACFVLTGISTFSLVRDHCLPLDCGLSQVGQDPHFHAQHLFRLLHTLTFVSAFFYTLLRIDR